jgi:hypothetical protein
VTTAILAAIEAGVRQGGTDIVANTIVDGYARLKDLLKRKFGNESDVINAIDKLEDTPDSPMRRRTVAEKVTVIPVAHDRESISAPEALLEQI